MKSIGLVQDGDNMCAYVNPVMYISFPQNGENLFTIRGSKLSQEYVLDSSVHKYIYRSNMSGPSLIHITQSINTYIDPVCPDHLTLRYCSCNTYLLHRRAELKAAPGST